MSAALPLALLGTPMTLGLARQDPRRVPGVAGLAPALRAAGIVEALGARDVGDLAAPADYRHERDPATGVRNLPAVVAHTRALAAALGDILAAGKFPLLLGGDCSVLLGALLASRRRGRCGLLHLDGHTDFYPPACSASGQVAAMELWIATGGAPAGQFDFDGFAPLVAPRDAVLIGHRDHAERRRSGAPDPAGHLLRAVPCEEVQARGAAEVAAEALAALAARGVEDLWIHLDVDVLDVALMPAVDTPEPGGLAWPELVALLRAGLASGLARGLSLTIFDPTLDPGGGLAADLVAHLRMALRGS